MLDFVCIFLIFIEIITTFFFVKKLNQWEKKVYIYNFKLLEEGEKIISTCKQIRITIQKINKVLSFVTSQKWIRIKNIIVITIETIQLVALLRSLKDSKTGKILSLENIKKIFLASATQHLIRKIISFV